MILFQSMLVAVTNCIYFLSTFFKMYFHPILVTGVFYYLFRLFSDTQREQQKTLETITID
jgi:hypothetical protein